MTSSTTSAFDKIADRYDEIWSFTQPGLQQRQAVWQTLHGLYKPGEKVLDIGCGTGVDAEALTKVGVHMRGIDSSREMVRVARSRGVDAQHLVAERVELLGQTFDGAFSNFGVVNCVADLRSLACAIAGVVRRQGRLAICSMGAFCLWETAGLLAAGDIQRAFRRYRGGSRSRSLKIEVRYWRVRDLAEAFRPWFCLLHWKGIGVAVPPSGVRPFSNSTVNRLARIDSAIGGWPVARACADHRLLVFARL